MRLLLITLTLAGASLLWLGATPVTLPPPSVVVFPLVVNGDADKDSGNRLAVIFAQQMAENGVRIVAPPPGTQRADYLTTARKLGCDYYVTGFITPLGAEVTVVEQIVSTASGTVVSSNSAQLLTYADASGQGAILASLVQRHATRGLASLGEAPPPAPTPAPKESQAEANLSGLGNIFKRKPKEKASAAPSPSARAIAAATPVPPKPAPARRAPSLAPTATPAVAAVAASATGGRIVLFDVGGSAPSNARTYARNDLQGRLTRTGHTVAAAGGVEPREVVSRAATLCSENGAKALVDAQLATRSGDASYGPSTVAQLDLRAVDCSGRVLFQQRFERDGTGGHNLERAVDNAVGAAALALVKAIR